MKTKLLITALFLSLSLSAQSASARELTGYVSNIIDVDLWVVGGETIQMWGLAVPDYNDHQDPDVIGKINTQIDARKVTCQSVDGISNSDYPVMKCKLGDIDVSRLLIRQGYARDCPKVTDGKYAFDEKFAIEARGARISEWFPIPRACQ